MAHPISDRIAVTTPHQPNLAPAQEPLGFLAWIAVYKLVKACIALSGGILFWKLGRQDLGEVAHILIHRCHISPGSWLATAIVERMTHIKPDHMRFAALVALLYAVLYCVEAVGLLMQKRWAEWLTVVQTSLLIPLELRQLVHPPRLLPTLALVASVGVVAYLIRRIRHDMLEEEALLQPR
jgi:uncharacterized membrane protein (DUF2068 family)